MISDVLDAYSKRDAEKAADIRRRDGVDDLHTSLFRELLTYMMEDPRNIRRVRILCLSPKILSVWEIMPRISQRIFISLFTESDQMKNGLKGMLRST